MDIFNDVRDDLEDAVAPELGVHPIPPNSPVRQPEQPVQGQNPPAVHDQAVHDQQDARPNRRAPRQNRSRSLSPRHNPHENSKYIAICY